MNNPSLQPIERNAPRYRELAYQAIKEAILSGELAAARSLVEEQLAEKLAISRTPVREALAILEHERLIGPRGGRGLYVRPVSRDEFIEAFEANEVVSPGLVRRAAQLISEEQVFILDELLHRSRYYASAGDVTQFLQTSREFHRRLGEAAENQPLADFILHNEERINLYLLSVKNVLTVEKMLASVEQYREILAAVARREAEEAARLVIYHAQSVRERFRELFLEMEQPGWHDDLAKLG
jgi:DNA-binding GntR family transcriptional regulator